MPAGETQENPMKASVSLEDLRDALITLALFSREKTSTQERMLRAAATNLIPGNLHASKELFSRSVSSLAFLAGYVDVQSN